MEFINEILRFGTPIVSAIVALLVYIYRTDSKRIRESIEQEKETRKDSDDEIITNMKEGLQEERQFRNDILKKYGTNIKRLWDKQDALNIQVERTDEKLNNFIEHMEKICKMNHKD